MRWNRHQAYPSTYSRVGKLKGMPGATDRVVSGTRYMPLYARWWLSFCSRSTRISACHWLSIGSFACSFAGRVLHHPNGEPRGGCCQPDQRELKSSFGEHRRARRRGWRWRCRGGRRLSVSSSDLDSALRSSLWLNARPASPRSYGYPETISP